MLRRNEKGEIEWLACNYEQYVDYKLKGKACMLVHYFKGKVITEIKTNIDEPPLYHRVGHYVSNKRLKPFLSRV